MTAADLPAVNAIAAAVHPAFPEDAAVFAERLALHPAGCFVLDGGGGIDGYIISHPWRAAEPPALDALLGGLPSPPTTYYIHDVALLPRSRGRGAGAAVMPLLLRHATALGLDNLSLVAVNNSARFWRGQGFEVMEHPAMARKLSSYGADARFMIRTTSAPAGDSGT